MTTNKKTEKLLRAVRKLEGLMEAQDLDGAAKLVTDIEQRATEVGLQSASLKWIEAIIFDNKGDHEHALEAIEVAVAIDPLAVAYANSRLVVLRNLKGLMTNPSRAADHPSTPRFWAVLVQAGEADVGVHLALARYHLAVGAPAEAMNLVTAVTQLNPTSEEAWAMRVQIAAQLPGPEGLALARSEAAAGGATQVAFVSPLVGKS